MQAPSISLDSTSPARGAASLGKAALTMLILSLVGNVALYLAGAALGAFPKDALLPSGEPMTIVPVLGASVFGVVMSTLAFAVLRRFVRAPVTAFRVLVGVVLVLAAYPPFTIPNVSTAMIIILNLMHVVVVGSAVWAFTRSER
jgi:uncharacterized protein DUF6069